MRSPAAVLPTHHPSSPTGIHERDGALGCTCHASRLRPHQVPALLPERPDLDKTPAPPSSTQRSKQGMGAAALAGVTMALTPTDIQHGRDARPGRAGLSTFMVRDALRVQKVMRKARHAAGLFPPQGWMPPMARGASTRKRWTESAAAPSCTSRPDGQSGLLRAPGLAPFSTPSRSQNE